MDSIHRTIADNFAHVFAGDKVGFSARQITDYFIRYSNRVKPLDHYGFTPKRLDLFIESLYFLPPKQQYYALNDLTWTKYESRYDYPSDENCAELRKQLHQTVSRDPIGMSFSGVSESSFREDWVTCTSRLEYDPPSTMTAARTMLETLFKTIIAERGGQPDNSGELGKLLKQVEDMVGFNRSTDQQMHRITGGFANIINGLAALSNAGGDRHGLVNGQSIDDPAIARLCVHAAGTLGIAFIEMHLFSPTPLINGMIHGVNDPK